MGVCRVIKRTVKHLIKKHGTNNPFEIASTKKINILFENLGSTLGYFHTFNRIMIIHINNNLSDRLQQYVCAHELGHAVLHKEISTPFLKQNTFYSMDKHEVEANTFAVELLLTDDKLNKYKGTNMSLEEIAVTHGVPKEVARLKKVYFF